MDAGVEGGMQDGRIPGRKGQLLSHLNIEHGETCVPSLSGLIWHCC
jgi:hypothetical protein